jgi:DNA modification methylase
MKNKFVLMNDNCLDAMKALPDNSVDSVVTDPPYGLSFMGKKWDYDVPSVEIWEECFRVLKPGGFLLSFAGTRTQHRMAVNIEDAGFEIRDMIAWVYGSGFPKSHNISKAIDKAAGADREVIGKSDRGSGAQPNKLNNHGAGDTGIGYMDGSGKHFNITTPSTDEAKQWDGWGTALKPALEPITVARKPFKETVANNVLEHGTGGINIDGCRVETEENLNGGAYAENGSDRHDGSENWRYKRDGKSGEFKQPTGRFPANLIHDGSDEVEEVFPHSKSGAMKKAYTYTNTGTSLGKPSGKTKQIHGASEGSASRFFYCAKTSKKERGDGNNHPTVKPIDLMRYLCRLVTQPNGVVLDPFMGSGSTGIAALIEEFKFIGIEMDEDYFKIAECRLTDNG